MSKLYNFKYKDTDRSVLKMTSEHESDSPLKSISGIDLSHLSEAEKTELKAELARHDAAMQKFMRAGYRKFKVSEMQTPMTEEQL